MVMKPVLIVEDKGSKYDIIKDIVQSVFGLSVKIDRAMTVVSAQEEVEKNIHSLVVLDISMDIVHSGVPGSREGHAVLGGMTIAEHMYLLEIERPTVIVTGFDYFVSKSTSENTGVAKTLSDIEVSAKHFLADNFIGCIKSGEQGWEEKLRIAISGIKL